MKINRPLKYLGLAAVALLLASAASPSRADTLTGTYINTFDVGANVANFSGSGSVASWIGWYGSGYNNTPLTNNVSQDAFGSAASGSLMLQAAPNPGDQVVYFGTFHNQWGYDFTTSANFYNYTNIDFDIKVDPLSPTNGAGNFGTVSVGAMISYGYTEFGRVTVPANASNSWVHIKVPIPKSFGNLNNTPDGLAFQVAAWVTPTAATGTTYWIDNLELEITPGPPPPPPSVSQSFPKAITGYNGTATDNAGQYDRYDILTTLPTGFSFVGQPSVTYAWTNKTWPSTATDGSWQQQLFFVAGGTGNPGQYDSACDWNFPNILWFTVGRGTNGVAYLDFRCKTNEPGGNGMLFNTETNFTINTNMWPVEPIGHITATTPLGGWSVTIAGTTVTITTPDQTSTNITIDPVWAALFADPMTLALGNQPNNPNGYGETEVISGFGVTGNATPFSEDFTTETAFNTNNWRVLAGDPNGVNLVPPGSAFWLSWTLPDAGFSPQTAGTVSGPASSWAELSGRTILNNGKRSILVASSELQGVNQNYFRLIQYPFNGLQVLLPGETNAPNTLTGKTGTPLAADTVNVVNVTVNAVDTNSWHIIPGVTDIMQISSSDGSAILPNNAPLVNGTGTYQILFQTGGGLPYTVTATNMSNEMPAATSSPVTVN